MLRIHHINAGTIRPPMGGLAVCHCLLLEPPHHAGGLILIDAGIGLQDVRRPAERLGLPLVDAVGFVLDETDTAARRIEARGFRTTDVRYIVLTHADPDHAGGLADFPSAAVHISAEEHARVMAGHERYRPAQFDHAPDWRIAGPVPTRQWFGLEARPLDVGFGAEVLLIPLPGHTLGHCGIAVRLTDRWLLHVGDAYYLRAALGTDDHPVSALAAQRADDDALRRATLEQIRRLARDHGGGIELLGYHDPEELPRAIRPAHHPDGGAA